MRRVARTLIALTLAVTAVVALLAAASCTPNKIYRPVLEPCDATGDVRADCAGNYVEERDEYVLGFVEFDDQGWFWNREQMLRLLGYLSGEAAAERGLLMVVFIHGWQHNARVCDTNVTCFRETLERLSTIERTSAEMSGVPPRRVAGIYVGWRGQSATVEGIKQTTFYSRKATAHRVGQRGVSELLLRLESLRDLRRKQPGDDTRLVYVGHSFGGAVLYSAVSQLLAERAIDLDNEGAPPKALGDLVVLVNPAFEAALYEPLWEIGTQRSYFPGQRPVLAILTSDGDLATGLAFPFGRFFSTIFQKHRRDYPGQGPRFQKRSNKAAVGHFRPFFTHELVADGTVPPDAGPYGDPKRCECPYLPPELPRDEMVSYLTKAPPWSPGVDEKPPPGWELAFPGSVLHHLADSGYDPLVPFMNVEVDNSIIHGHSGIYRPVFIDFLRFFISLTMGDAAEVEAQGVTHGGSDQP